MRKKTNPELRLLITDLKKSSKPIYQKIAKYLSKPKRKAVCVNIEKINKKTKQDEVVIVPGKVLAKGELEHKLTIAAFNFSDAAREKLSKKADMLSITELMKKISNFKNINIRILT